MQKKVRSGEEIRQIRSFDTRQSRCTFTVTGASFAGSDVRIDWRVLLPVDEDHSGCGAENYFFHTSRGSVQLPIQSKGMWMLKNTLTQCCSVLPLALSLYCNLQHRNTVKCQTMVVRGGMSGERPICNYFLLNQHKVAALQCSTLAWIKTTCGAGWRKALAQQAPKESAAPFPCKFPRLFDIVKHLIVAKKSELQGLLPFMVSTWIGIKAASCFDVFIPL